MTPGPRASRGLLLLAVVLAACSDSLAVHADPSRARLAESVSGAAAAALQVDGTFRRGNPQFFGAAALIDARRATDLATAFITWYGRFFEPAWREQRGTAIDARSLVACGTAQFVASPYEPIVTEAGWAVRKAFGPRFRVSMCAGGVRQVVVSVSALATDVSLNRDGLEPAEDLLVTFAAAALPPDWEVPIDAEEAAQQLATVLGVRISTVPRVTATPSGMQFIGQWDARLERSVLVRDRAGSREQRQDRIVLADDGHRRAVLYRLDSTSMLPPVSTIAAPSAQIKRGWPATVRLQMTGAARPARVQVRAQPRLFLAAARGAPGSRSDWLRQL